jgi:very-short-patch-repair endonuclease
VPRTLLDLAELLSRRELERAFDQAEVLRVLDAAAVEALLVRSGGRRGAVVLRALLAGHDAGGTLTRSELEERFLAICRSSRIRLPEVNALIDAPRGALQVDFAWRAERLVVETDGHATHGTRLAFERDRRRDQRLALAGWRVVRFTWSQVIRASDEVARTVRALLGERRGETD